MSGSVDEDLVARVFRVQNMSRVSEPGALWRGPEGLPGQPRQTLVRSPQGLVTPVLTPPAWPPVPPAAGRAPAGATLPVPALVRLPGHA